MMRIAYGLVVAALVFVLLLAALALALGASFVLLHTVMATGPALLLTAACALALVVALLASIGMVLRPAVAAAGPARDPRAVIQRHPLPAVALALTAGVLVASSQSTRDALADVLAQYVDLRT